MGFLIETRNRRGDPWEVHGNYTAGGRSAAEDYARRLLADERQRNPNARVRVNGKVIRKKRGDNGESHNGHQAGDR